MKKILSILLALVFISGTFAFAAPFPDLPADHWATEAVKVLAEKGLVEGYPNGTFKGDRAATRYEVAMVVARLIAYLEKRPQVTKEDLDAIKRLVNEFKDELDAMGVRLKNVEDLLASLEKRVTELERVQWSGSFVTRYATSAVSTCANCTMTPFQIDATAAGLRLPGDQNPVWTPNNWNALSFWGASENLFNVAPSQMNTSAPPTQGRLGLVDQNKNWNALEVHNADREAPNWELENYPFDKALDIYPTRSGSAVTEQGYLKVRAHLSDEYNAGGIVSVYNDVGSLANGYIYGVTPSTLSNPFQAGTAVNTAGAAFFGTAATNLSANLNQIFVTNEKQNIHLVVGDWRPALINDHILQGLPNMGVYGPDYLPFYGGQLYGRLAGTIASGLYYEAAGGRLSVFNPVIPTGSTTNYQNILVGGALAYEWNDLSSTLQNVRLTGDYLRVMNDSSTAAGGATQGINNPGLWANPNFPGNIASLNSATGTTATTAAAFAEVGPQTENLYGAELKIHFGQSWKWLNLWGKYGTSQYNVSRGASVGIPVITGSMASAGLLIDGGGKITGAGEFVWVQPQYDPFIAQVPIPNGANGSQSAFTGAGPGSSTLWMGFPYPVAYGAPYTTFIGNLALQAFNGGATPILTTTTGGANGTIAGGDQFYNIHDARKYPNNRVGGRGQLNWNYGPGNIGGKFEWFQQVTPSNLPAALSPGFYEPIFVTLPSTLYGAAYGTAANSSQNQGGYPKGYVQTYSVFADYTTVGKELTLDGIFSNTKIKRFASDFNNINLNMNWFRGGLTYRPAEKWSLLAGYEQYASLGPGYYLRPQSNQSATATNYQLPLTSGSSFLTFIPGQNLPPNMVFTQKGPYVGADYAFVKGTDAFIMYRVFNLSDFNTTGQAGFSGSQLSSGLRFIF